MQRLVNGARLVGRLADKSLFEVLEELQIKLAFGGTGFFANDSLHGSYLNVIRMTADGVLGVELIRHI